MHILVHQKSRRGSTSTGELSFPPGPSAHPSPAAESRSKFKRRKQNSTFSGCAPIKVEPRGTPPAYGHYMQTIIMIAYLLLSSLIGLALLPLFLYFTNPYFLKDLRFAITTLHIAFRLSKMKKHKPFYSILDCFLEKVSRQPDKAFIVFEERSYTYHQADTLSSKAAAALRTHAHLEEGDTVALFLGNEPQFVWLWLGLAKLGCTASLLNTNIRSKSLMHCFSCCEAKVLVAGAGKMGETLRCCPALLL